VVDRSDGALGDHCLPGVAVRIEWPRERWRLWVPRRL
jgi:hypothetical protein